MILLPIVGRELRQAARRASTHWGRVVVAGAIAAVFTLLFAMPHRSAALSAGQQIFVLLTRTGLVYALLTGVVYASDCLSEEKRDGTLGLLFLTDLRSWDVVLGKLAVRSLHAIYWLIAAFPILCLPVLMGGVTGGELMRTTLALTVAVVFSLSLGTLVSALGYGERQVLFRTAALVALISVGFPLMRRWISWIPPLAWINPWLQRSSPLNSYAGAFETLYFFTRSEYWMSLGTQLLLSLLFLAGASVWLPRSLRSAKQLSAEKLGPFRNRLTDRVNPCFWMAFSPATARRYGAASFLVLLTFGLWTFVTLSKKTGASIPVAIFGTYGFHIVVKTMIAIEAVRRFHQDRRSGALELLLCTPLPSSDVWKAQKTAVVRTFRFPLVALACLNMMLIGGIDDADAGWVVFRGALLLVPDAFALTYVGMVQGLVQPRFHRAWIRTVGIVLLVPAVAVFLFFFMAMVGMSISQTVAKGFFLLWSLAALLYDLFLIGRARAFLKTGFRSLAAGEPLTLPAGSEHADARTARRGGQPVLS